MLVIKQKTTSFMTLRDLFFFVVIMSQAGCSWGVKAQKPHTALFTAALSQFCLVSDFCPRKGLDRGESPVIFLTEEEQVSLVLSLSLSVFLFLFHIKMSGEAWGKDEKFTGELSLLDCPPPLLVHWDVQDTLFVCIIQVEFFPPVSTSGCSSDLNGTGQDYVQSVCNLLYAMMRWLLRSLMSAAGTRSFFTGVGIMVERLPLGLNKSETKNTMQ